MTEVTAQTAYCTVECVGLPPRDQPSTLLALPSHSVGFLQGVGMAEWTLKTHDSRVDL